MPDKPAEWPEKYRHDLAMIRDAAALIIKDFGLSGVPVTFSGHAESAFSELNGQVIRAIRELERNRPGDLMALLYRIDVAESLIIRALQLPPGEREEAVARLILERTLTRAVFRKLHSR